MKRRNGSKSSTTRTLHDCVFNLSPYKVGTNSASQVADCIHNPFRNSYRCSRAWTNQRQLGDWYEKSDLILRLFIFVYRLCLCISRLSNGHTACFASLFCPLEVNAAQAWWLESRPLHDSESALGEECRFCSGGEGLSLIRDLRVLKTRRAVSANRFCRVFFDKRVESN